MKKMSKNAVIIYQSKSGGIDLKGDFKKETIWATQAQMAAIFDVNPQAVTKHLQSVYQEKELSKKATCSKMEQVRKEGSRTVKRSLEIYNLDVIISIGYRINSLAGTKFRQWATKTIREHITQGYTLNKKRVAQNLDQFLKAVIFFEKISCQKKTQQNSSQMSELITVFMASLGMYSSLLAEKIFIQPWKKKPSIYFISW